MSEKILVVDDDLDTLRLVGLMLQRQGYEIVAASNGQQSLQLAKDTSPDLILLDVMMPDMDGIEVAKQLREEPRTKDIPIIMFTARSQVEDKILGYEAGADDYLTKPTQPRELFAHVKAVLSRVSKSKIPAAPVQPPTERAYTIGVLSGRGGLGVTTLVTNLGLALSRKTRHTTIVADYRPGQGTLSLDLGVPNAEGFNRLLSRPKNEINARMVETELLNHGSGVRFLLSSPQPKDASFQVALPQFEAVHEHLAHLASLLVLDLGVGITPIVEMVLPTLDEIFVVVEPVVQTLNLTKLLLRNLNEKGIGAGRISLVVVNRTRSELSLSLTQIQEQMGHNILTIFTPAPELAFQAAHRNIPIYQLQPDSLTAQQFSRLVEKILERAPKLTA